MNIHGKNFYCLGKNNFNVGDEFRAERLLNTLKFKIEQATENGLDNHSELRIAYTCDGIIKSIFTINEAKRILKLNSL
jgi:hypothetical protein